LSFQTIVEDIMSTHHSLLRRELPRISELMERLTSENLPGQESDVERLKESRQIFEKVRAKVEAHLRDEELVLFPTGIALESGREPLATKMNFLERLTEMEKEHDGCGKTLNMIAQTIAEVSAPTALRDEVLSAIQNIQDDFVVHVDKENNRVHPMFIELLPKL
jgi:iron-sulfur cluster repair protein YtfE (RIC family)